MQPFNVLAPPKLAICCLSDLIYCYSPLAHEATAIQPYLIPGTFQLCSHLKEFLLFLPPGVVSRQVSTVGPQITSFSYNADEILELNSCFYQLLYGHGICR